MALPTMRPHWVKTFKNPMELSTKRLEKQGNLRLELNETNKYFKSSEVQAERSNFWTSERSFKRSMNAVDKLFSEVIDKEKKDELQIRRQKLRELFTKEQEMYEKQLRELRYSGGKNLLSMQKRVDELHAVKEEERKRVAEEKLHEHWRKNEPRLREMESAKHKRHVVKSWGDQVNEKEEIQQSARENERRIEHYMEVENLKALEEEKKQEEKQKLAKLKLADELRGQMVQIRDKEEEAGILRVEEEKLQEHERLLQQVDEKRKLFQEQRKRQELGRVLIRQYRIQLKRKSKQVQDALEFDLQILKEIAAKEKEEQALESSRKEKMKADAEYMQQIVADQLRLEKSREAELDLLYQDEASREWRKRESEWECEKLARERLMKVVLEERQEQIKEKMEQIHQQKKESIEERERLLQQMEEQQRLTHREMNENADKKKQRGEELMEQISARETERERTRRRELEEAEQQRAEKESYEVMLLKEAERLNVQDDSPPPSFRERKRKKKVAFM